ncbi:pre-mRNA-splicing factor Slu7-like [Coccinella septempunctata]|uniref:pre-mRNA-splicing factor Slu7-like n=1 Tax=Coccinella septempunctata TaxID=41139 RepID=UPI001D06AA67|nr:pre-mRNA-splicing factor Slu7-like [Coccinella septempunctata]
MGLPQRYRRDISGLPVNPKKKLLSKRNSLPFARFRDIDYFRVSLRLSVWGVERRRTIAVLAPDEFFQKNLLLSYDGKKDRWSGYEPSEHTAVIEEFQKIEEAKRQLKAEKLNAGEDSDEEKDEDKYVDEIDIPGTKVDSKQRITVRNYLRIREDTAKYLRNLDPNSAFYDPKTRSMRENPNPGKDDIYSGENFVRFTGDTQKHYSKAQLFAWEAYEKGVDVHLLAEPTKLELLQKEYDKKKDQFKNQVNKSVLEKYGGEEHLQAPPKTLLLAQTEDYVEYSRSGKVIKGQEKEEIKSKYEEDVYINNHTSVWGSYWQGGQWGYKCCKSFIKNSYCLGEATVIIPTQTIEHEAKDEAANIESSDSSSQSSSEDESKKKKEKKKQKKKKHKQLKKKKNKEILEEDKLKKALIAEEEHQAKVKALLSMDERKRPYNSMYEVKEPTEEEMEAYHLKRRREEDPMNQFLN